MKSVSYASLSMVLPVVCLSSGQVPAEEMLPKAYDIERYTAIWQASPFNREIAPPVTERSEESGFSQSLALEGLVEDSSRGTVAYVKDLRENRLWVITSKSSDIHPYTIVSSQQATNPTETVVSITDGKKTETISYAANMLTRKIEPVRGGPPAESPSADAVKRRRGAVRGDAPGDDKVSTDHVEVHTNQVLEIVTQRMDRQQGDRTASPATSDDGARELRGRSAEPDPEAPPRRRRLILPEP